MFRDEIDSLGLFMAGLQPLQAYNIMSLWHIRRVNTAGAVNHVITHSIAPIDLHLSHELNITS